MEDNTLCEPCMFRKIPVPATKYCEQCDERYCETCMVGHTTQKLTRKHILVEFFTKIEKKQTCDPCSYQNKAEDAEFLCVDCNEHLCQHCKNFHESQKINKTHIYNKLCLSTESESTSTACTSKGEEIIELKVTEDCTDSDSLYSPLAEEPTLPSGGNVFSSDLPTEHCDMMNIGTIEGDMSEKDVNLTPEMAELFDLSSKLEHQNLSKIPSVQECNNNNNNLDNVPTVLSMANADHKDVLKDSFSNEKEVSAQENRSIGNVMATNEKTLMPQLGQMASILGYSVVDLNAERQTVDDTANSLHDCPISFAEIVKGNLSARDEKYEEESIHSYKPEKGDNNESEKSYHHDERNSNIRKVTEFGPDVKRKHIEKDGETILEHASRDIILSDHQGDSKDVQSFCEPCLNLEKQEPASHYCIDCNERYCGKCTKRHKSHQMSQSHELVDLGSLKEDTTLCDPCKFDGEEIPASFICKDCKNEHLCNDCKDFHKAQKQTKNHKVTPVPRFPVCEGCFGIGKEEPAMGFCISCPEPELFCQQCSKQHLSLKCTKDHEFSADMLAFLCMIRSKKKKNVKANSDADPIIHQEAPNPRQPGKPYVTDKAPKPNNVLLKWQEVEINDLEVYQIMYKEGSTGKWKTYKSNTRKSCMKIEDVKPQTTYIFRVRVINESTGEEGLFSPDSDEITTRESAAAGMMKLSTQIYEKPIAVFALPVKEVKKARNVKAKTRKLYLGNIASSTTERNIMMVGATGSGKSTLINAFANYILGVTWEDPFRFTLINIESSEKEHAGKQAVSQTEWITCYTIHPDVGSRLSYTINLIDTPGFGDTRGLEYDQKIVDQVRELFTVHGKRGIATIDAVCFILKAPDARLSATQMYIFEAILSLFGKDIQENICSLITFADGEKPPVLAGLEALEHKILPYDKYFTFNNSALYVDNIDQASKTAKAFWEMGIESCREFFEHIVNLPTKSLQLTAEVLGHRETLEITVYNLHQEVDVGLSKIDVLEQEIEIFSRYRRQIRENKDFYYTVVESVQEIADISGKGHYTTNCLTCNYTCHERCKYSNDLDKHKCCAMDRNGNCKQCPSYCHWTEHHNTPYIIKWVPREVRKKYSEKQKIYEKASKMSLTQEQVLEAMTNDIEYLEYAIASQLDLIAECNNRLREIALRPDPLSTVQYIDLIIDAERREKKSGFEARIDTLEKCKKKAQYGMTVQIFQDRVQMTRQAIEDTIVGEENETSSSFIKQVKKVGKKIINALKI